MEDLTLKLTATELTLLKAALLAYENVVRGARTINEEQRVTEFTLLEGFRRKLVPLTEQLHCSVVDDLV